MVVVTDDVGLVVRQIERFNAQTTKTKKQRKSGQ